MKTNYLISVIVPVYNAEKYLTKCIESILGQTYPNIELLLINDGSTDGSAAICEEYVLKDNRVKVTHKRRRSNDVVYDSSVKALVVYLSVVQFLPYGRIASF